jgi:hypothetical protein
MHQGGKMQHFDWFLGAIIKIDCLRRKTFPSKKGYKNVT